MEQFASIEDLTAVKTPVIATIGTFDGVHLGHRKVIQHINQLARAQNAYSLVITFQNHPREVLFPEASLALLCSSKEKAYQLQKLGVDGVVFLQFSHDFSKLTAGQFLQRVCKSTHLIRLVLGPDASFGHQRSGSESVVKELGQQLGFEAEYLPHYFVQGQPVSSSRIRHLIQGGHLEAAEALLGRPYSFQGGVIHGKGRGRTIGIPTANIDIGRYCLPPYGVYEVSVEVNGKHLKGIANLGLAPTVHVKRLPQLEVHLFDFSDSIYEQEIKVTLQKFLRPEKRFSDVEQLKEQILQDIQTVKSCPTPQIRA